MNTAPHHSPAGSPPPGTTVAGWLGFLIGPAFFVLAAWFLFGPELTRIPVTRNTSVARSKLSTAARRETIGDPPTIVINGFERRCNDCHALFPLGSTPLRDRQQHSHVQLDHGINDTCRNCHDVSNMNRLVLYSGESIPYSEVPQLCQKCHGPTYQDWESGIHGRINDYWSARFGPPRQLKCIECHDPHQPRQPAMEPLAPLPGPNTLRMGRKDPATAHEPEPKEERDPLLRTLQQERTPHGPGTRSDAQPQDGP